MTNPGVNETMAGGEQLVSLFGQLHEARSAQALAGIARHEARLNERGGTGIADLQLTANQVAGLLGGNALRIALDGGEADEQQTHAQAEIEQLEEELLDHAGSLAGKEMEVEALPGTSGGIRYKGGLRKLDIPAQPTRAVGAQLQRPAFHVLEGRLELVQIGFSGLAQNIMYGNYDIRPIGLDGKPRVAITVDA